VLTIGALAGLIGLAVFGLLLHERAAMGISLVVMLVCASLALLSNLIEGITTGRMVFESIEAEYQKSRILFIGTLAINLLLFMFFGGLALKFLRLLFYKWQG
jgi:hypothetical protein